MKENEDIDVSAAYCMCDNPDLTEHADGTLFCEDCGGLR